MFRIDRGGDAGPGMKRRIRIAAIDRQAHRQALHHLDQLPVAFSGGSSMKVRPVPETRLTTLPWHSRTSG